MPRGPQQHRRSFQSSPSRSRMSGAKPETTRAPPSSSSSQANPEKSIPEPRPSSSVILVSPKNEILLLHRVQNSSSFPSAHVFPGGNISPQDGAVPPPSQPKAHHADSPAYRRAAIRETFEESGILLARPHSAENVPPRTSSAKASKRQGFRRMDMRVSREMQEAEEERVKRRTGEGGLLRVTDKDRDRGRKAVHSGKVYFQTWVKHQKGFPDIDGLIPFTRWITPANMPKRYTTQMYLYFLPLPSESPTDPHDNNNNPISPIPSDGTEMIIPTPTPDGGIEHTAAKFLPAQDWLSQARSGEIILFPPQFFLLTLVADFLAPDPPKQRRNNNYYSSSYYSTVELATQRERLLGFIDIGTHDTPAWKDKCISPRGIMYQKEPDHRAVLDLSHPGPELDGTDRRGDDGMVILVDFREEGPRRVEIREKKEVLEEQRRLQSDKSKL